MVEVDGRIRFGLDTVAGVEEGSVNRVGVGA